MNKEPTEAQIKEFWEWCGLNISSSYPSTFYPDGKTYRRKLPPIDINNLFEYAEPVLLEKGWYISIVRVQYENIWRIELYNPELDRHIEKQGEVLEDEVSWAIWEVIHNE